jgi:hypothetical protein
MSRLYTYLDLLSFSTLRERVITFATMFNPDGDGLACYRRQRNCQRLGKKQPWEVRNWEVKFWFWRKWRLLKDSPAIDAGQLVNDTGCGGFVMAGALKRFSA